MTFAAFDRIWLTLAVAVVAVAVGIGVRAQRRRLLAAASDKALGRSLGSNWRGIETTRLLLRLLAALAVAVALLRPQYGVKVEHVSAETADLVIALDLSRSMMAEDLKPSRLTRVKQEIQTWLRQRHPWRVALVGFEGVPAVFSPLTTDHDAVADIIDGLNTGDINIPGTNIASAIEASIRLMDAAQSPSRLLLLVTDGEDHSQAFDKAVALARAKQVRLFVAAVGSVEGAPIPTAEGGFIKDNGGNIVISRMNETVLMDAARSSQGALLRIDGGGADFEPLFAAMDQARKSQWSIDEHHPLEERFQIPLLVALLLLSLEPLVALLRRRRAPVALGILALCVVAGWPASARADAFDDGTRQYEEEKFQDSAKSFLQAAVNGETDPIVAYDLGNALYRAEQYPMAISAYAMAATVAQDTALKFESLYNAGNAAFRAGSLDRAIFFYREALKLVPDDEDARVNLEIAKRKLMEHVQKQAMRKQMQSDPKPSDKPDDPKDGEDQSEAEESGKQGEKKKGNGENQKQADEKKKEEERKKQGKGEKKEQNPLADKMLDRIQEPDKRPHKETRTRGSGMNVDRPW